MGDFLDYLKTVPDYLKALPIVIAGIGAWIAYRKFRLDRQKFRLDLSDKRVAVYSAARDFLSVTVRKARVEQSYLDEYQNKTRDAAFLFDRKIKKHLRSLYDTQWEARFGFILPAQHGRPLAN